MPQGNSMYYLPKEGDSKPVIAAILYSGSAIGLLRKKRLIKPDKKGFENSDVERRNYLQIAGVHITVLKQ